MISFALKLLEGIQKGESAFPEFIVEGNISNMGRMLAEEINISNEISSIDLSSLPEIYIKDLKDALELSLLGGGSGVGYQERVRQCNGSVKAFRALVDCGIDVKKAMSQCSVVWWEAILIDDANMVKSWISADQKEHGVEPLVGRKGPFDADPLHYAAQCGSIKVASALLECGAIHTLDDYRMFPSGAAYSNGYEELGDMLQASLEQQSHTKDNSSSVLVLDGALVACLLVEEREVEIGGDRAPEGPTA